MKKLLALMLLAASAFANAGSTILTTPNKAGGFIRLTDNVNNNCPVSLPFHVYSTTPDGTAVTGCWRYNKSEGNYTIQWSDGAFSVFEMNVMTMTDYGRAVANHFKASM